MCRYDVERRIGQVQKIEEEMPDNALEIRIVHVLVGMRPGRIIAVAVQHKTQTAAFTHARFTRRILSEAFRHLK